MISIQIQLEMKPAQAEHLSCGLYKMSSQRTRLSQNSVQLWTHEKRFFGTTIIPLQVITWIKEWFKKK